MRPTLALRLLSSSLSLTLCVVAVGIGCSSSTTSGTGGATSGTGGSTGSGGAGGTGGSAAAFTAVAPCQAQSDYTTTGTTVMFGGSSLVYAPKCLKVAAGASVTFTGMDGEKFSGHPLAPSAERGTLTGNPITSTSTNESSKSFTFPTPGFYAYFCTYHGVDAASAADSGMAGVVWVQ